MSNDFDELMKKLKASYLETKQNELESLQKKTNYTEASKSYETPTLRWGETRKGQYAEDNFPDGYKITGWDVLDETPKEKEASLHEYIEKIKNKGSK